MGPPLQLLDAYAACTEGGRVPTLLRMRRRRFAVEPVNGYIPSNNPDQPDDDDPTNQPFDMAGIFWADDAALYWIDGNGNKLIYKYVCTICVGGKPNYAVGASGSSWGQITEQIKSLKLALAGPSDPRRVNTLFASVEQGLQRVSYDLAGAIANRRTIVAEKLEASVRSLEDGAQSRLQKATAQYRDSRLSAERGDTKSAVLACDAALSSLHIARAALDTAENWFE